MNYDQWCAAQAAAMESAVRDDPAAGMVPLFAFPLPASGNAWGRLIAAPERPAGALPALQFPRGSDLRSLPFPDYYVSIWHACRRLPVCGI